MNMDFHYFAVKTIAIYAGFSARDAQDIAFFSQYVDDYNAYVPRSYGNIPDYLLEEKYDVYQKKSEYNFNPPTTGFEDYFDMATLMLSRSQRYTVAPFHFLVKNKYELGVVDTVVTECSIGDGSLISDSLLEAKREYESASDSEKKDCLMKIGMLLHIFADTCAHEGFSGYHNSVNDVSLLEIWDLSNGEKAVEKKLFEKYTGSLSPVSIGHGMVGHVPDLPSLKWKIKRKDKTTYERNNKVAFLRMAKKIYEYLASIEHEKSESFSSFESFKNHLEDALCQSRANTTYDKFVEIWNKEFDDIEYYYDVDFFRGVRQHNATKTDVKDTNFYKYIRCVEDHLIFLYGKKPRAYIPAEYINCDFSCDKAGQNSKAVAMHKESGLILNGNVVINGSSKLGDIIKFNDGGKVNTIQLIYNPSKVSVYTYEIRVRAGGPHGPFSGSGYLRFIDRTGDHYDLSIFRSKEDWHVVDFNSEKPEIDEIKWSNKAF